MKKAIGWTESRQQRCTCITLFCTFLCRHCTTTTGKCLISRFIMDVNKQRLNFLSLSELDMVLRNSAQKGFACIWQSKWFGVIAIEIERTQIHFSSDVFCGCRRRDIKNSLLQLAGSGLRHSSAIFLPKFLVKKKYKFGSANKRVGGVWELFAKSWKLTACVFSHPSLTCKGGSFEPLAWTLPPFEPRWFKMKKISLPVDVRRSKTPLLKLPI